MNKFRSTWLALMGGAILVTLSISAAFGADPVDETESNRGQTIAGFVHSLIFTQDDPADEETDEDETVDEEVDEDEESDEAEDEDTEESDVDADVTGAEHGACVSEAANKEASGDEEAEADLANHGEWVSLHARYICWGLTPPDEEATKEETEDEAALDDDADTEELSAKAERKADKALAKADKLAAKAAEATAKAELVAEASAAKAERKAERAAARAERTAERSAAKAERGNGGGHGKP